MIISTAYAQTGFCVHEILTKPRATVEKMMPHKHAIQLTTGTDCQFQTVRYDDSILVSYEDGLLQSIEITTSRKNALQIGADVIAAYPKHEYLFNNLFLYDSKKNQYLLGMYHDDVMLKSTVYITLMSSMPKKAKKQLPVKP